MAFKMKGFSGFKDSPAKKELEYYTIGDRVYKKGHGRINNPEKDKVYQAYLKRQESKKALEDKKKTREKELENLRNEEEGTRQNF
tara:strand:+ start:76 stop:330 length:255 start_codon:yes stop_codon:yes gene_type:complete